MKLCRKGYRPCPGKRGAMTPLRHPKDQAARDREIDQWLEHAMGVKVPDPMPVLYDLDD